MSQMTEHSRRAYRFIVACGASGACLVAGCASRVPASGFLDDYAHMQPLADDAIIWDHVDRGKGVEQLKIDVWVDRRNEAALKNYDRVLVDPVTFMFKKGSAASQLNKEEIREALGPFREDLRRKLGDRYTVVDQPGPGVIRLRRAVTGLRSQQAYATPDRDQLPEKAFLNSRPGEMITEYELADAQTGERLGACVIRVRGNYLDNDAPKDVYDQAERGLRCTASFFRAVLDRAHGFEPGAESTSSGQSVSHRERPG